MSSESEEYSNANSDDSDSGSGSEEESSVEESGSGSGSGSESGGNVSPDPQPAGADSGPSVAFDAFPGSIELALGAATSVSITPVKGESAQQSGFDISVTGADTGSVQQLTLRIRGNSCRIAQTAPNPATVGFLASAHPVPLLPQQPPMPPSASYQSYNPATASSGFGLQGQSPFASNQPTLMATNPATHYGLAPGLPSTGRGGQGGSTTLAGASLPTPDFSVPAAYQLPGQAGPAATAFSGNLPAADLYRHTTTRAASLGAQLESVLLK
jgi:hypothetical protein|eukprot:gnl/Ergobibamus_cyprinoides/950.p1 GENE.gnl/Ergobibamus_cyprinoides/950~~gnl/Ergobibamus_cyprinoides/950.p1  ORF type:complete len:270 (+),score=24.93 gnl/Ergobibamus_cyprinoides/950:46-855(+)